MTKESLVSAMLTALGCSLLGACSNDNQANSNDAVTEDGRAPGSGGAAGKPSSGGATSAGGKNGSSGTVGTGGKVGTGGTSSTGGTRSSGGSAGIRTLDGGSTPDSGKEAGLEDAGSMQVALHFKATVGSKAFACGTTYTGQGSSNTTVEPRDFRFYVQDVRLLDQNGKAVPVVLDARSPWQTPEVGLLDFEDGTGACVDGNSQMNDVITGVVPNGKYSGVIFVNGVPDDLNHGDPLHLPAPLQVGVMTWGWLFGFKFVKAELGATAEPAGDAEPGLGLVHVGSTGCSNVNDGGQPDFNSPPTVACSQANRNEIRLEGFAPATSTIVADIGALFGGIDLSVNNQCHSEGPSCPTEFAALGLDFTTHARKTTQSMYRVE